MFTLLLITLLVVVGGGTAWTGAIYYGDRKRRALGQAQQYKALPSGDRLIERTVKELRVGDVLTLDGTDFLVEGVVGYDEDGHRWSGARIVDGGDVRWLVVGLERIGAPVARMLSVDKELDLSGYPPEVLVVGETRYSLDKRGTATCRFSGDLGGLANVKGDRPEGTVERCRWWLYGTAGDDTLIVEQWAGEYRGLRGKKIAATLIDMIPGS